MPNAILEKEKANVYHIKKNGFSQNTKSQKLTGQKSRLIHLYWLEIQKRKNGKKDILLDLKTEKSMLGMTV